LIGEITRALADHYVGTLRKSGRNWKQSEENEGDFHNRV
jgi:hypothetical protein